MGGHSPPLSISFQLRKILLLRCFNKRFRFLLRTVRIFFQRERAKDIYLTELVLSHTSFLSPSLFRLFFSRGLVFQCGLGFSRERSAPDPHVTLLSISQ